MPDKPITPSEGGPAVVSDPMRPTGSKPSGPSTSGDLKVPEFLAGKMSQEEFASLPESARTVLVERSRMVQEDYRKKTTDLAEQRKTLDPLLKIQEQLTADPKMAEHLDKALADYKAGRVSRQELQDEWEQLKEEADTGGLRVLKAIEKRFGDSNVVQELKALRDLVGQLVVGNQTSRRSQLDVEMAKLPMAFKPLAEEHREKLIALGLKPSFAQDSVRDLLMRVAPREAYESAYFQHRNTESEQESNRIRELAGFPSVAGAPETPVVLPEDIVKSRDPRYGDGVRLSNIISRVFGEAKRRLPSGM